MSLLASALTNSMTQGKPHILSGNTDNEAALHASAPGSLLTAQFPSRSGVLVTVLAVNLACQFPSDLVSLEVEAVPLSPDPALGTVVCGPCCRTIIIGQIGEGHRVAEPVTNLPTWQLHRCQLYLNRPSIDDTRSLLPNLSFLQCSHFRRWRHWLPICPIQDCRGRPRLSAGFAPIYSRSPHPTHPAASSYSGPCLHLHFCTLAHAISIFH